MQTQKLILEVEIKSAVDDFDQYEQLRVAIDRILGQMLQLPEDVGSQHVRSARVVKVMPQRAKRTHRDVQLPYLLGADK